MKVKKTLISLLYIFLLTTRLIAITYVYTEKTEGDTVIRTVTIINTEGGYKVISEIPSERIECDVTKDFSIKKLHCVSKPRGTDIFAVQEHKKVVITGTFENKKINKEINMGYNASWQQEWIAGVNYFCLSGEKTSKIDVLSLEGNIQKGKFISERLPDEVMEFNEVSVPVYRVVIKLGGFPGLFVNVDANFWIRKNDGVVLKTTMPHGPGKPLTITELIEIKE